MHKHKDVFPEKHSDIDRIDEKEFANESPDTFRNETD